jgi:DNA gyrase subunit A
MGRGAHGVKGITLAGDDYVVGVAVVDETKTLLTITDNGVGKRTPFSDFREMKHRGGRGVCCHKISEKTGKLAAIIAVDDDDDIMIITNEGTIIRTSVSGINVYSRTAGGVIVMRLSEGSYINNIARLEKAEKIEEESKAIDEEIKKEEAASPAPESKVERAELDSDEASF